MHFLARKLLYSQQNLLKKYPINFSPDNSLLPCRRQAIVSPNDAYHSASMSEVCTFWFIWYWVTHELPNDPSTNQSSGIMYGIRASYQYKDSLSNYGIFIMKIIISSERLIFIMGIPRLVRRHLYIETVPWLIPNSTPWFPERHICSIILALGSSSSYQGVPSTVTYHGFTMSPCAQLPTNYLSIIHYFNEAVVALSKGEIIWFV